MHGGRAFYEERAPAADEFDLMRARRNRHAHAGRHRRAAREATAACHYAINYFLPAPDGSKVAVGISAGGSEAASLFVYDAASGAQIAGPVDRAEFGATSWSADAKTLYFIRLKKLADGAPQTREVSRLHDRGVESAIGTGADLGRTRRPRAAARTGGEPGARRRSRRDAGAVAGCQWRAERAHRVARAGGARRRSRGRLATVLQPRRRHHVGRTARRRSVPAVASRRTDVQGSQSALRCPALLQRLRWSPLNRIV